MPDPITTTPAAPAPPAPATETPPPPAPEGEGPRTIAEAVREARQKLDRGESIVPQEEPDALPVGEAEEVDVGEQAGDGSPVVEGGEGEERKAAPAKEQPPTGEGEGDAEEVDKDLFTVRLPPRREGEDPMEFDLEGLPKDAKEGFQRLMKEGLRRDQLNQAMESVRSMQEEVQDILISMETDPINFVLSSTRPELRASLARHILSDPEIYDQVVPEIAEWDRSGPAREAALARLERDRIIAQNQAQEARALKVKMRNNAAEIVQKVHSLVPEGAPEDVRELFADQALRIITQHSDRNNLSLLDPNEIEPILRQTLVFRLLETQPGASQNPNPGPSSAAPARPAAAATSLRAPTDIDRIRESASRRKAAAAVTPPGAGTAPVQPPEMPEVEQRNVRKAIAWYKKNVVGR